MRSTLISNKKSGDIKSIQQSQYNKTIIEDIKNESIILDKIKGILKTIESKLFPITTISEQKNNSLVLSVLPFRVRISNIGIPGYGQPIGIAIVGINNYILWYNLVYGYHSYYHAKI